jgi:hypothetical protein
LAPRLNFLRFEFKYVLRADLRREVESALGYFVQLDPFVAAQPHKKYFVRSLYFDDPDFGCYFAKIDGQLHRAKFRLRTYAREPNADAAVYLELKGRHDSLVFKQRTPVRTGAGAEFMPDQHDVTRRILAHATPSPVLERFQFEVERKRLVPVMLIDYERRPYVSKYDPEFRLTFDDQLRATRTQSLFPGPTDHCRDLLTGYTVMEVKFRHHVPAWFHRILQSYGLRRQSVSKICKGMETWRLTPQMEF